MENIISFKTKFGWISATETNKKISKIQFCREKHNGTVTKNLRNLRKNFINYFMSKKIKVKIPMKIDGNTMQKKVWNELKKIKAGKTKTYGEIAKKLRISPRYVGRICGENKHIIIIPCHRVIRSDGSMGGFSARGGVKLKEKLLRFEGSI